MAHYEISRALLLFFVSPVGRDGCLRHVQDEVWWIWAFGGTLLGVLCAAKSRGRRKFAASFPAPMHEGSLEKRLPGAQSKARKEPKENLNLLLQNFATTKWGLEPSVLNLQKGH